MAQQELISDTFVELADTLVDEYDVIDFLHRLTERCVSVLGVDEAGVALTVNGHPLAALASSSERMRSIELLEVQVQDGPCLDAYRTGTVVREHDLSASVERWPNFAPAAVKGGFRSVYAIPMRLRDERIGALNLFANRRTALGAGDERLAQALADVATIGILNERFLRHQQALADQLQTALESRSPRAGQRGRRRTGRCRHRRGLPPHPWVRPQPQPSPDRGGRGAGRGRAQGDGPAADGEARGLTQPVHTASIA